MKTVNALLLAGVVLTLVPQTSDAMEKFLKGLPNGSKFKKTLGHKGDNGFTPFGGMFSGTWSASLCKDKFPGSSITVGQAFGDPCCTWSEGGKPDFEVTFTDDFPAQSTKTCASGGGGGGGGAAAAGGASNSTSTSGGGGGGTSTSGGDAGPAGGTGGGGGGATTGGGGGGGAMAGGGNMSGGGGGKPSGGGNGNKHDHSQHSGGGNKPFAGTGGGMSGNKPPGGTGWKQGGGNKPPGGMTSDGGKSTTQSGGGKTRGNPNASPSQNAGVHPNKGATAGDNSSGKKNYD